MKLAEHYRILFKELEARTAAYLRQLFPDDVPSKLYVGSRVGIEERTVTHAGYAHSHYRCEDPTRKDLYRLRDYVAGFVPGPNNVCIYWRNGGTSGAVRLNTIDGKQISWTRTDIEPFVAEQKALYDPKEGHTPCSHCSKQCPTNTMFKAQVISVRNFPPTGRSPMRLYCDSTCAMHNQWAYEG